MKPQTDRFIPVRVLESCILAAAVLSAGAPAAIGQAVNSNSSYLNAAAQLYDNAAAKCGNPAGAACMRSFANYERCQAGGGSCGAAPTCSTSCIGGGAGTAGGTSITPTMTPAQTNAQNVVNMVNLGFSLYQMFHKNTPSVQPEAPADAAPAPDPAAEAAAQQQLLDNQAAQILASASALLPSQPAAAAPAPAQPDPNATLDGLLDDDPPADSATDEVSALLGGGGEPDPGTTSPAPSSDPTAEVSALLGGPAVSASSTPVSATPVPTPGPSAQAVDPLFAGAAAQSAQSAPSSAQVETLDTDLQDDNPDSSDSGSIWDGMKDTANSWANAAGDLFNSHPLQSIAQSLGLSEDPNADPIDNAIHTCGVDLMAGAAPYPVGADAGAAGCMTAIQKQGMGVLGMATDQGGSQ